MVIRQKEYKTKLINLRRNLNDVIYEKVAFLSQFTNIYVGRQKPKVLKRIKQLLKNLIMRFILIAFQNI